MVSQFQAETPRPFNRSGVDSLGTRPTALAEGLFSYLNRLHLPPGRKLLTSGDTSSVSDVENQERQKSCQGLGRDKAIIAK